jgi:hypothetical protein
MLDKEYPLRSSILRVFIQSLLSLSFLGPGIIVIILLSNILNLYSSMRMKDQVLHP